MVKRRAALAAAMAAGVGLWAIHPPVGWWPLAFAVPAVLAAALELGDEVGWHPALVGALSGGLATVIMVHWVRFRAGAVAWVLLALVGAAWFALLGWLLQRLLARHLTALLAPLVWVGIDAWRNAWPLGGFGWGTLGVSQVDNQWLLPLARILGEKGLTLVVAAISLFAFVAVRDGLRARSAGELASRTVDDGRRPRRSAVELATERGWFGTAGVVVVMLAVTLVTVAPPAVERTAEVLAVQPNDQERYTESYTEITRILARQALEVTRASIEAEGLPDLVVWPEGSIGRDPHRDPELMAAVSQAGILTQGRLLVGTDLEDPNSDNYRRVLIQVGADGSLGEAYVKRHLVPFGEFVPFRDLIDWFPPLRQTPRNAIAADRPQQLTINGLVLAVAICFETMFPDIVSSNILAGDTPAQLVIGSTSDASFGRTGQPAQHVAQSRMRAIENGRWVVHATVSGITTFIDQEGGTHGWTDLFTVDAVRAEVGLTTGLTPFLAIGDVLDPISRIAVVLAAVAVLIDARRRSDAGRRSA